MNEGPTQSSPGHLDDDARIDAVCFANILDTPGLGVFFKDRESRFIRVNVDCSNLNGRTRAEMIGLSDADLTDPAHAAELRADELRIMSTGESIIDKGEADRLANQPGTWVETSKFPMRDSDGAIIGTFGFSRDVTRREVAERGLGKMADTLADTNDHLRRIEAQLRAVLNSSIDGIAQYDRELRYKYINPAGERFRGKTFDELIGRTDREVGMTEDLLQIYESALRRVLDIGEPEDIEFAGLHAGTDDESWFYLSLSPDRDSSGDVVGALTTTRDITQIKRAERILTFQTPHDSLTGLANRHLLMDRLGRALPRLQRRPGRLALFFVDLDHFKQVNDQYGHDTGDRVLVDVARRLTHAARRQDTVARLGGDEFVVLCDQLMDDVASSIAARIVSAFVEPYRDGALEFPLSVSVGAVVTEDPHVTRADLLEAVDSAMYRAKAGGRNRFEIIDTLDSSDLTEAGTMRL